MVPPEADKLLSFDCCWPPEMAVNSCLILLLQSSLFFRFPSLALSHLFLSFAYVAAVLPACLLVCWGGGMGRWQRLVWGQDNNGQHLGTDTDAFKYACTRAHTHARAHTHTHACILFILRTMCECVQENNQVTIYCAVCVCTCERERARCLYGCVGVCWFSCSSPPPSSSRATGKHRPVCLCLFPFELASFEPPFRSSYIIAQQPTSAPR